MTTPVTPAPSDPSRHAFDLFRSYCKVGQFGLPPGKMRTNRAQELVAPVMTYMLILYPSGRFLLHRLHSTLILPPASKEMTGCYLQSAIKSAGLYLSWLLFQANQIGWMKTAILDGEQGAWRGRTVAGAELVHPDRVRMVLDEGRAELEELQAIARTGIRRVEISGSRLNEVDGKRWVEVDMRDSKVGSEDRASRRERMRITA